MRARARAVIDRAVAAAESRALAATQGDGGGTRLGVVFLRWDEDRDDEELTALDSAVTALPGCEVVRAVVDNRSTTGPVVRRPDGALAVPGDNAVREFTGWRAGVDAVRTASASAPVDVWLLANDRFRSYGEPYLDQLSGGVVRLVADLGAVAGRVDRYPGPTTSLDGLDVSAWVATNFVLIADAVLRAVGGPVQLDDEGLARVLPVRFPGPDGDAFLRGGVGPAHAALLLAWLTDSVPSGLTDRWYRRFDLDEATWPEFRAKVRSILNEQLLSARARSTGAPVVPLSLLDRLARLGGAENPTVAAVLDRLRTGGDDAVRALERPEARLRLAVAAGVDHRRVRREGRARS